MSKQEKFSQFSAGAISASDGAQRRKGKILPGTYSFRTRGLPAGQAALGLRRVQVGASLHMTKELSQLSSPHGTHALGNLPRVPVS